MKPLTLVGIMACLALGSPDVGLAATPRIVIRPPLLNESIRDSVVSSGEDVVGLSAISLSTPMREASLQVSGIRPEDRFICVYIERVSGLYTAEFSVPNPNAGPTIVFQLKTRHILIGGPRYGEYAVAAQPSPSARCSGRGSFLPVAWTGQPQARLSVLINSQQANYVAIASDAGSQHQCRPIATATGQPQLVTRSFDTVCEIAPPTCGQDVTATVFRRDLGDSRKPVKVQVRGRC